MGSSDLKRGLFDFHLKGLDGRDLDTETTEIEMGLDNRAFITDYSNEVDTNMWTYKDNYLGGSFEFDVDVSDVPCSCATHVYLTKIDD